MKKKEAFILALLIFANRDGQATTECPKGTYDCPADKSNGNYQCPSSSILMFTDPNSFNCCDDVILCTGSGMVAHFCQPELCTKFWNPMFIRNLEYKWDQLDMTTVQMGTSDDPYLCPKPMSHLHVFHYDDATEDEFPPAYMPVDFKDMDSVLSTCSSNKGCADGQFCGYVVNLSFDPDNFGKCSNGEECSTNSHCSSGECTQDKHMLTYVDKEKQFCYKLPQIPHPNNVKMIVTIREDTVSLHTCNSNGDCDEYCNLDLIQKGSFGSYNPAAKKTNYHKGLCMESRPFAFLFADFFGGNNNVVNGGEVGNEVLPYMPPGMVVNDRFYKTRLTNCASNKDCAAGHFCDYRYSLLLDQGHRHSSLKYCYKIPALSSSNARVLMEPDQVSLYPCTADTDCEVGYCVLPASTTFKFAKFVGSGSSPQMHSGLCVEGESCGGANSYSEPYKWDMSWGKCTKNADCVDHGGTKVGANAALTFESTCLLNNGVGKCCYREMKQCKNGGKIVEPSNRCGKSSSNDPATSFADCYGGLAQLKRQATRLDKWCDLDINQCCQQQATSSFCPDGQTPLFNEPTCSGYDVSDEASGTCQVKRGAVCKLGHCCPGTKVDSSGNVIKGTDSYETNVPCTPGVRPPQFPNGYCDPTTGKVVIIGQNATDGNPYEHVDPANPKVCQKDADCSNDQSTICIFVEPNVAHCFKTPKSISPPLRADGQGTDSEEDESTYYIIVGVLILALILIIIAVIIGILVFMKNKKNKKPAKKGKNGKNGKKTEKNTKKDTKKKGKGKGKKKKKVVKTETSSSPASSSTAMTGSVGGTGTSTGGYSPAIV